VGVVVHGADLPELFANAALAMFSLMADLDGVGEGEVREVAVQARDLEGLLVHWLTELLYHLDAEELLFCRFQVLELSETAMRARAFGERVDRERHRLHFAVKAVTRHLLRLEREDGGYRATILFDI